MRFGSTEVPELEPGCPKCGTIVEDVDLHITTEPHWSEPFLSYTSGYSEIFLTLLPCQHRYLREGFMIKRVDLGPAWIEATDYTDDA